jgi:transposase
MRGMSATHVAFGHGYPFQKMPPRTEKSLKKPCPECHDSYSHMETSIKIGTSAYMLHASAPYDTLALITNLQNVF